MHCCFTPLFFNFLNNVLRFWRLLPSHLNIMVSFKQQAVLVSAVGSIVKCFILGIGFIDQNSAIEDSIFILRVKLIRTLIIVCEFLGWVNFC